MELNKIYHIDNREGIKLLPDKCVNLIISDPPYFEIKGEFDFTWKTFEEYLKFMEEQAISYSRVLADNGTLFIYGDRKNIAYVQVIFDKYFNLENHIVWKKPNSFTEAFSTLRSFPNRCFERILMYSSKEDVYNLTDCVFYVRDYIRGEILKSKGGIVFKDINTALGTATNGGGVASTCLSLDKDEPAMITEELYNKLKIWCEPYLEKSYSELRTEYEKLKELYEEKRRPFDNFLRLTDCWEFTIGNANSIDHPTVKPEDMTRAMILTCSRRNDLVLIPFSGSGTECAMAAKEGRNFIGFDNDLKYVQMSINRVEANKKQLQIWR